MPARNAVADPVVPDRVMSQDLLLALGTRSDKRHHAIRSDRSLDQRAESAYLKGAHGINGILLSRLTTKQQFRLGALRDLLPLIEPLGLYGAEHAFALKKALSNRMALLSCSCDKPTRLRETVSVVGSGSNNERDFHGLNTKSPGKTGA